MASPILQAYSASDFLGKMIFLSLFALSILSWVIIAYKLWLNRCIKESNLEMENLFKQNRRSPLNIDVSFFQKKNFPSSPLLAVYQNLRGQVLDLLRKNKDLTHPTEGGAVFLSSTDIEQIGYHSDIAVGLQRKKVAKYLYVLSIIYSLAPLLGLLGTVWGISVTFNQLPHAGNALSNEAVLSGLAMALGTTVVGIVIAIPALIGYHALKQTVEEHTAKMDQFSSDFLQRIEMQYRAVDVQKV